MKKENLRIKENITIQDKINVVESIVEDYFRGGKYTPYFAPISKIVSIATYFIEGYELEDGDNLYTICMTDDDMKRLIETFVGKYAVNNDIMVEVNSYVEDKVDFIQSFQSGQVQKAYQDTLNAEGSAQQEQDRWLDSIEAKQQQFQAAFQKMATTTLSSDVFKGFVDGGTSAVNVFTNLIDKVGVLNTAAIGLGIFQGKTGSGKSTWEFAPCIFQMTYAA